MDFNFNITLALAVSRLRAIAADNPDRIGKTNEGGCVYFNVDDQLSGLPMTAVCIIGQFFADFGLLGLLSFGFNEAGSTTGQESACFTEGGFWSRLKDHGITADPAAQKFMRDVQLKQDGGDTWSVAFNTAVERIISDERARIDAEVSDYRINLEGDSPFLHLLANDVAISTPEEPLLPWDVAPWTDAQDPDEPPF